MLGREGGGKKWIIRLLLIWSQRLNTVTLKVILTSSAWYFLKKMFWRIQNVCVLIRTVVMKVWILPSDSKFLLFCHFYVNSPKLQVLYFISKSN